MKKVIKINGMSCMHCKIAVEKALNAVDGIENAKVDLNKKEAVVTLNSDVTDEALVTAVNEAGYEAVSVEIKKGLFG